MLANASSRLLLACLLVSYEEELLLGELLYHEVAPDVNLDKTYNNRCQLIT
jgi:hypothetical protein